MLNWTFAHLVTKAAIIAQQRLNSAPVALLTVIEGLAQAATPAYVFKDTLTLEKPIVQHVTIVVKLAIAAQLTA
jgi:hypothetical protein